jgi:primosomal protein N' (replication factor Y) (superfamily II helicase)
MSGQNKSHQKKLFSIPDAIPDKASWETAAEADYSVAKVVLNLPLLTEFHYIVPDALREWIGPGQRVKVPFGRGNRFAIGYCVGILPARELEGKFRKLKSIEEVIDKEPLISPRMLELTKWISEYYLSGWGQVLEGVIPAGVKNNSGTREILYLHPAENIQKKLGSLKLPPKQKVVLDVLTASDSPLRIDELTKLAGCGTGPVNGLREKGFIEAIRQRADVTAPEMKDFAKEDDLELNPAQNDVLKQILISIGSGKHQTILLHGVTGSGKTEVYIQAIREVVSYGRQAIVLVPEISLTPQTIRRFRSRFDSVAVLHSHLSDAERHWHWQQIAKGEIQVIVGARSAVFAPTPHLGLIVIDEEHETSFKQSTTPRYHTREVARKRCKLEGIPLLLGTATPTLESWNRAITKKDLLLSLPSRVSDLPLPPVVIVDTRNDPHCSKGASIGRILETGIRTALADKGQVILFLNLRGFAPALWCRACSASVKCPHCDISLTWHKDRKIALCHSCEYQNSSLKECPNCHQPGLQFLGVGTQRLEQEVRAKFRGVKCLRMDSDTMRKPGSHDIALESFRRGEARILLGTQMIAKGLDFPNVTVVGVISADTILNQPDIRAAERTYQLISQVAGRTGRSERGGRVFVQTSSPDEYPILCAAEHDYLRFAKQELVHRQNALTPPYTHLARVIIRGEIEEIVKQRSKEMAKAFLEAQENSDNPEKVRILGPAPAPITKLKKNYRYHFQMSAKDISLIHQLWKDSSQDFLKMNDVEIVIDVDPVDLR